MEIVDIIQQYVSHLYHGICTAGGDFCAVNASTMDSHWSPLVVWPGEANKSVQLEPHICGKPR